MPGPFGTQLPGPGPLLPFREVPEITAGPTLTPQAVDVTMTLTAALVRLPVKVFALALTVAVAMTRMALKPLAFALTLTVAMVRSTSKLVAVGATVAAALSRQVGKLVAALATLTAALTNLRRGGGGDTRR